MRDQVPEKMMLKKYLLWFDILGFEKLAEEIAGKTHLAKRKVRTDFINILSERVEFMEAEGKIIGKNYGERDDWILIKDSLDSTFEVIFNILEHNTDYEDCRRIPLEVSVGTGQYDKWARFEGRKLIVEEATIKFLKTKIIGRYHELYKQKNKESPSSTFILFTESAYNDLEILDRRICRRIEYIRDKGLSDQSVVFFAADKARVKQRGRMFIFLEKIKHPNSRLYCRIDELYVHPSEYYEIIEALERERIVFITGTPEYGKTYTAVRLLWEYFEKGYEPIWSGGGEEIERREARRRLEEIEKELQSHRIIYFEDPFGTTRYESRDSLEREIGRILSCVKNVSDAYILITSREEIFKRFEKEHLSSVQLRVFEKTLNIKRPSYNYEKRKEILLRWAESKNCLWFNRKAMRDFVVGHLLREENLPTPLSIRNFVFSTINIAKKRELEKQIILKSKETTLSFAKEISYMPIDKIVFLMYPFISSYFPVHLLKEEYEKLIKELNIKSPWKFKRVVNWFKDDKIEISSGFISFSHPSYREAIQQLLGKRERMTQQLFCKVLWELSNKSEVVWNIARVIAENFDLLPDRVREELLVKLSKMEGISETIAKIVEKNFDKLSDEVRNELLLKLYEYGATGAVASVTTEYFDKHAVLETFASIVLEHFHKLPEEIRDILFKLSERKGDTVRIVAWAVAGNFNDIPVEVRNELLLQLSKKDAAASPIKWIVTTHFDKLPVNVRKSLCQITNNHHTS